MPRKRKPDPEDDGRVIANMAWAKASARPSPPTKSPRSS